MKNTHALSCRIVCTLPCLKVIEDALETVAMMLGEDKARGYCLEMICADFLSGAHLCPDGNDEVLVLALKRTFELIGPVRQARFLDLLNLTPRNEHAPQ